MDNRLFVTQAQLQKLVAAKLIDRPAPTGRRRVKWPGGWKAQSARLPRPLPVPRR